MRNYHVVVTTDYYITIEDDLNLPTDFDSFENLAEHIAFLADRGIAPCDSENLLIDEAEKITVSDPLSEFEVREF